MRIVCAAHTHRGQYPDIADIQYKLAQDAEIAAHDDDGNPNDRDGNACELPARNWLS